jgi:hypothetical protein
MRSDIVESIFVIEINSDLTEGKGHIQRATEQDREKDAARKKKKEAMARAKKLGLTEEDVKALGMRV